MFVTGTFDDWGKTVRLDRVDDGFAKTVSLPIEKVQYKAGLPFLSSDYPPYYTAPGDLLCAALDKHCGEQKLPQAVLGNPGFSMTLHPSTDVTGRVPLQNYKTACATQNLGSSQC